MTSSGGYGDAFKKAKREHNQREQSADVSRLQAEANADSAALSDLVIPELHAAIHDLKPHGGEVEIRLSTGLEGRSGPSSVAFCVKDHRGHTSRAYLIEPRTGAIVVTSGGGFDKVGRPRNAKDVSKEVGIQRREDLTTENVRKLIHRAIEEYRNDRDDGGPRITTIR